jgi:hypothetical protein
MLSEEQKKNRRDKKYHLKYYQNNKEKVAKRTAKWRKENPEKRLQIDRDYRAANPEKMKEYYKKDYEKHKEKRIRDRAARGKIYWAKPENKERKRQHAFARYNADKRKFAILRQATEMRGVIIAITGEKLSKCIPLEILYDTMVQTVKSNPVKASELFLHGKPDASNIKTEFKVGFDRICRHQFVWNILNGYDCAIRWSASYDDIELALRGGINKTKLFNTYKDFVLWKYGANEYNEQCPAFSESRQPVEVPA